MSVGEKGLEEGDTFRIVYSLPVWYSIETSLGGNRSV